MASPCPEHVTGQLDLYGHPVAPRQVAQPNPDRVTIRLEIDVEVAAGECWPDGEPAVWDPATLAASIRGSSPSLHAFLSEWGVLDAGATLQLSDALGRTATVVLD